MKKEIKQLSICLYKLGVLKTGIFVTDLGHKITNYGLRKRKRRAKNGKFTRFLHTFNRNDHHSNPSLADTS